MKLKLNSRGRYRLVDLALPNVKNKKVIIKKR